MSTIKITEITETYVHGMLKFDRDISINVRFNGPSVRLFGPDGVSLNPKIINVFKGVELQYVATDIVIEDLMGKYVIRGTTDNPKNPTVFTPIDQIKVMSCDTFNPTCQEWYVFVGCIKH